MVSQTPSKFRNEFLTESEGCSFHAGEVVINKLRRQIPNNEAVIKVISKDDKNLSAKMLKSKKKSIKNLGQLVQGDGRREACGHWHSPPAHTLRYITRARQQRH